jgi:hypothetical protein
MARALPPLPGMPVVQLTGALSLAGGPDTSVDVVREVAGNGPPATGEMARRST